MNDDFLGVDLDSLSLLDLATYLITDTDWEAGVATTSAIDQIDLFLDAARRQMERMEDAQRLRLPVGGVPPKVFSYLAADALFYFVCWHRIERMMFVIARRSGVNEAEKAYATYESELKHYARAREHIQHMEQRFPGQDRASKVWMPDGMWMFGSVDVRFLVYQIGKERWDISRRSLDRLEAIVTELQDRMRLEMVEKLINRSAT